MLAKAQAVCSSLKTFHDRIRHTIHRDLPRFKTFHEADKKTYEGIYSFKHKKGLVNVISDAPWLKYPDQYPYKGIPKDFLGVKLSVHRHEGRKNTVEVRAILPKENFKVTDKSELESENFDKEYARYGMIWTPWTDNTIYNESTDSYLKAVRHNKLRGGGSRLTIRFGFPGKYTLIVPFDADLGVNLSSGDIIYCDPGPAWPGHTWLKVDCPNGKIKRSFRYDYYEDGAAGNDPFTHLKTKNGDITI